MNGSKIYHLEFKAGSHHYFGSITAIFDLFNSKTLNVSKYRLWNYKITPDNPYSNDMCTIRKGVIKRKKTNRSMGLKKE